MLNMNLVIVEHDFTSITKLMMDFPKNIPYSKLIYRRIAPFPHREQFRIPSPLQFHIIHLLSSSNATKQMQATGNPLKYSSGVQ